MPMTLPEVFTSGPAGVARLDAGVGLEQAGEPLGSARLVAGGDRRPVPVIAPFAVRSTPVPPALPIAVTRWPMLTFEVAAVETVFRFEAPSSWMTATSLVTA